MRRSKHEQRGHQKTAARYHEEQKQNGHFFVGIDLHKYILPCFKLPPFDGNQKSSLNLSLSLILVNYSAALGNLPQGNVHATNDSKMLSHVETCLFNRRSCSLSKSVDPMLRLAVVVRLFQRLPLDSTGKGVDDLDCAMLSQRASRDCCTPDFNIRSLVLVYFT